MCIGVPMKVVSCSGGTALAVGRGEEARLDAMLVDDLRPGDWVLAFRGAAVRTMSEHEAAQTDAALDALAADPVIAGALGPPIVDTFLAVKRFEVERHRTWVSDWEIDEYLHHL